MRNWLFLIGLLLILGLGIAHGTGHISSPLSPAKHSMTATVDSVSYRPNVTRVYCRVIGKPHTSQRIDSVRCLAGKATDIDPLYFGRAFQWEDEGEISLEIDFPPMTQCARRINLTFFTPYGIVRSK